MLSASRIARDSDPGFQPPLTFIAPGGRSFTRSGRGNRSFASGWIEQGNGSLSSRTFYPDYNYNHILSRFKARRRFSHPSPVNLDYPISDSLTSGLLFDPADHLLGGFATSATLSRCAACVNRTLILVRHND
jgi:hypothetical protein